MGEDEQLEGLASLLAHYRAEAVSQVAEGAELRRALLRTSTAAERDGRHLAHANSEGAALRIALAEAQRSLREVEAAHARSEAEVARGRRAISAVEDELRRERARIRTLQAALTDIRSSLSWRITRPLRALRR